MSQNEYMKICYVANYIEIPYTGGTGSGGATHVYEVASGLRKAGHQILLLCAKAPKQPRQEILDGIKIKRIFKNYGMLYYFLKRWPLLWPVVKWPYHFSKHLYESIVLFLFLLKEPCGLVYERSSLGTKVHCFFYRLLNIPLIIEVNDYHDNISCKTAQFIVTPNRSAILSQYRDKTEELQWGANIELFKPGISTDTLKKEYKIQDKKVVLIVCSGVPWHGLNELIIAAKTVIQKRSGLVFMVVGGGEHFSRYKEKVCSFGLNDNFIFTGVVKYSKIPEFMNMADICVAPYNSGLSKIGNQRELFASPLKVFEYMACAKPVVLTNIANKNMIIEHMRNGILIKEDSPEDISVAIIDLLENGSLRFNLGKNARETAERNFSWQSHIKSLERIFLSAQTANNKRGDACGIFLK